MQTKWTALGALTLLIFISLVPLAVSTGDGGAFWMWMPESITPAGQQIGWIFNLTLVITGVLFVDIHAIMIFFVIRYREFDLMGDSGSQQDSGNFLEILFSILPSIILILAAYYLFTARMSTFLIYGLVFFVIHSLAIYILLKDDSFHAEETSDLHGHLGIEITWTIIPTIIMIVLGIYSFDVYSQVTTVPDDPIEIQVTGLQFQWQVKYPENDVELNNRMVLPRGKSVQLHMTATDVLHSFYVPSLRMKQDVIPGQETHLFIENINQTGQFDLKCAELCGVGHYRMMGDLYVVSQSKYDEFLSLESRSERLEFLEKVSSNE